MATRERQDIPFASDPQRQQRFLDLIADAHSLSGAAKLVGVHRDTVYDLRQRDPAFAAAVDKAVKQRGDFWEDCLRKLGEHQTKPDTLAVIVGLKKEGRFIEPQYQQKLAISVNVNLPFQDYTADQLRALIAKLDAPTVEGQVSEVKALPAAGRENEEMI